MEWAMHQVGVLRRNRRTKLKKDHYKSEMTKEQVLTNKSPTVDKVQWTEMVNYWFLDKTVTLSNKNKVSQGKQKEIARFGPKSFAQISDDMVKANEASVEHTNVYLKVYARKDGAAITLHAQENMNRIEELLTQEGMRLQGELGSGVLWSKDDAYAWVFGLERHGRVRGVGFGITPSGRSATNNSQVTSTSLSSSKTTQRISALENNSSILREQLAKYKNNSSNQKQGTSNNSPK
ncbi:uncharacterized protein LOC136064984 [Quercus suber]|uniref:uncharacterized protein LOC136064984 n=1 Tax=Quercus suber TaxID=58331 RepID=UPI0032DF111A